MHVGSKSPHFATEGIGSNTPRYEEEVYKVMVSILRTMAPDHQQNKERNFRQNLMRESLRILGDIQLLGRESF